MKTISWKSHRKEMLRDPKLRAELKRLGPEFEIAEQIIKLRLKKKMTQSELARRAGTRQEVISRIESGNANPRLDSLGKISKAFDGELKIKIA
ncbi:MAG: helix-turn-helix transcriptional regulator [Patescibacteria group bacterium]|nr:helix-turn-helix transcriptional regulator [Patescibacteria group bacterium]